MIDLTPKKNKTEKVEKKEKVRSSLSFSPTELNLAAADRASQSSCSLPQPAKPPKASTSSKASTSTSADETAVANLKKIVVACGMRKQWKKEFAGFEEDVSFFSLSFHRCVSSRSFADSTELALVRTAVPTSSQAHQDHPPRLRDQGVSYTGESEEEEGGGGGGSGVG